MSRRELREYIFKLVFRVEFNEVEEMPQQEEMFFENIELDEHKISEKDSEYITNKTNKIIEHLEEIDKMINERTTGWTIDRMGKVDLAILRLGVYELVFDDDVPTGVAINEAVELAKKFGQEESSGFVNGVLAKFVDK